MSEHRTYINTDIDYDRDGKQVSYLRLPYSRNTSAWGIIPIPVAVMRNGDGPTVLITAGNHGDEYEGQIAANNLIRALEPRLLKGRVIILPALNFPAAMAGRRVSPIDGLNLNRVFPGDPDGTPTRQIADYLTNVILPKTDAFIDLHSGGYSMNFLHTGIIYRQHTPELMKRAVEAAEQWGMPYCIVLDDLGERRTIDAICRDRGLIKVGTELSGGASVSVAALAVAETGLWRLLAHFGVLVGRPPTARRPYTPFKTRLTEIMGPEAYLYAVGNAIFEPNFALGDEVSESQVAGWQHYIDEIGRDPFPLRFRKSGIVVGSRGPGRVAPGDLVAVVVSDLRSP
jgi:predicted deacylase